MQNREGGRACSRSFLLPSPTLHRYASQCQTLGRPGLVSTRPLRTSTTFSCTKILLPFHD
eukprot:scaffold2286_cov240-Pinguiococcus_pyrenoidosus.AAC.7